MDREFKFPPNAGSSVSDTASSGEQAATTANGADATSGNTSRVHGNGPEEAGLTAVSMVTPSSVEVPPPPPIEKERSPTNHDDGEEDVGETEEISLN